MSVLQDLGYEMLTLDVSSKTLSFHRTMRTMIFSKSPSIQPTASLEILELYQEMGCSCSGLSFVVCLTKPFDVLRNTPRDALCN